ncbi:unnamed protein product [Pleuronectes platessa]|uniref:Uncharacterized protein n=1 Tax=Pleuronectes platessa TaxID=8262 RepID=A0A9N7UFS7_PLEPL|nr:unnamed protein product [Pleuronectes platessa]
MEMERKRGRREWFFRLRNGSNITAAAISSIDPDRALQVPGHVPGITGSLSPNRPLLGGQDSSKAPWTTNTDNHSLGSLSCPPIKGVYRRLPHDVIPTPGAKLISTTDPAGLSHSHAFSLLCHQAMNQPADCARRSPRQETHCLAPRLWRTEETLARYRGKAGGGKGDMYGHNAKPNTRSGSEGILIDQFQTGSDCRAEEPPPPHLLTCCTNMADNLLLILNTGGGTTR